MAAYKLIKEYTVNHYLYKYCTKFNKQLETFAEVDQFQLTFISYLAAKSLQKIDSILFLTSHYQQYGYFKHASFPTYFFIIYKYLLGTNQTFV
jgi:hypothetical protein